VIGMDFIEISGRGYVFLTDVSVWLRPHIMWQKTKVAMGLNNLL